MFLEVNKLTVYYEKSLAINEVSLEVEEGAVVSIIGANGAGKSTILRALTGLTTITTGEMWFMGNSLNGREVPNIVKLGIVHVPEGRQLFPYLSVKTNLELGASIRRDKDVINRDLEEIYTLFPILLKRHNQKAGTLSGGEQQMLAIGRGLMAKPKLLLLDEPSLGLAPIVIEQLGVIIKDINKNGVSVLLVEQNVHLALEVATRSYVLQVGRVVLEGDIAKMRASPIVRKAYLGG